MKGLCLLLHPRGVDFKKGIVSKRWRYFWGHKTIYSYFL